jgi:Ring finger domain
MSAGGGVPWLGTGLAIGALSLIAMGLLTYFILRQWLVRLGGHRGEVPDRATAPAMPSNYEAEALSIRQTRARMWSSRNGHNGITIDELDLVAPVRAYSPGRKGANEYEDDIKGDGLSDAEVDAGGEKGAAVCDSSDSNVPEVYGDATDDTCVVCLDDMCAGDKTRELRCGHEFHGPCIETWLTKQNRCPVCNVEPLEASALAKHRNARSTARRGIDAALSTQQRRRRTRGQNGVWHLTDELDDTTVLTVE